MEEKIKVVMVRPGKFATIEEIDKSLESYQQIVGGYIEQLCPYDDPVAIVCNEEGKLSNLPLNRGLLHPEYGMWDIVAGVFFICGLGEEDYCSLTEELAAKYWVMFKYPEQFARSSNGIMRFVRDQEF